MMWPETQELKERIMTVESVGDGFATAEIHQAAIRELGETALREGALYTALNSFKELNDLDMVRQVGEACLEQGWLHDAGEAFFFLGDRERIFEVAKATEAEDPSDYNSVTLQRVFERYLGDTSDSTYSKFFEWAKEHGFPDAAILDISPVVNMAYNLADNYDIGIGIARGGCFSTYIFNQFGLETKLASAHRAEEGVTFEWADEVSDIDITGKKIIVFDKDVVSGRTSQKVLEILRAMGPESIDLVLNHNPVTRSTGIGTLARNIPDGYQGIFFPKSFSYGNFDKAVERLEQSFISSPIA